MSPLNIELCSSNCRYLTDHHQPLVSLLIDTAFTNRICLRESVSRYKRPRTFSKLQSVLDIECSGCSIIKFPLDLFALLITPRYFLKSASQDIFRIRNVKVS